MEVCGTRNRSFRRFEKIQFGRPVCVAEGESNHSPQQEGGISGAIPKF